MDDANDAWVVIPAFNEEAKIAEVVRDVRQVFAFVVVVDDGSSDQTAARARAASAAVIHHSTDYVFDRRKPTAYVETDATIPRSAYSGSKLAGEQAARSI